MTGVATTVLGGLATLAVAVVAGCYLDGALVLLPAQRRLTGPAYVEVEQASTALGTIRYRLLLAAAVTTQVALLVVGHDPGRASFWLTAASAAALAGSTVAITICRVVPLNRLVHTWDPRRPPPGWSGVRDRWHRLHRYRTAWAAFALVAQVGALLPR